MTGPVTISNDVNLSGVAVLDVLSGAAIAEAGGTTLSVGELEGNGASLADLPGVLKVTDLLESAKRDYVNVS